MDGGELADKTQAICQPGANVSDPGMEPAWDWLHHDVCL